MLNGDSAHRGTDAQARARILQCSIFVNNNMKYDTPLLLYVGVTKSVKESSMSVVSRVNDIMYNFTKSLYQKFS